MSETSFERKKRLLKPFEFKRVFDNTELRSGTSKILVLASANQLDTPRIGFVFAKKNMKRAVDRNRVKRIIRESFRQHQSKMPALDFVILGRKGLSELDNTEIRAMIDALWFRLKRPSNERKANGRSRKAQINKR